MSEARNVTAAFAPNNSSTFALNVSVSGNGSIASQPAGISCGATCSALFAANTSVTLTATPGSGQQFSSWSGACAGSGAVCTLGMSADRATTAIFNAPTVSGWQTQTLVSQPGLGGLGGARTAMAPDGSAMTTWVQPIVAQNAIIDYALWSSRYTPGAGWSAPVEATRLGLGFDENPAFAMGANGHAIYAWRRTQNNNNTPHYIDAVSYTPSTGWSVTRTVSINNTNTAYEVKAGMDDSGNGFVAWGQFQPAPKQFEVAVYASRFANGNWGGPQILNTDRAAGNAFFNLAVMPNGNAVSVWNGSGRDGSGYQSALFNGSSWAAPVRIMPNTSTDTLVSLDDRPSLAVSNAGAVLSWSQLDLPAVNDLRGSIKSLRLSGSAWESTPRDVASPALGVSNELQRTQAAINAQGAVAVIWQEWNGRRLFANRSQASGAWGTPEVINGGLQGNNSELLQLGVADNGNIMAAWYQTQTVATTNIYTSRYTSAGWSAPLAMMDYDSSRGLWAQHRMATNARGDAVLTYVLARDIFNTGSQIFSRIFIATP
jgi:hypothetical protein